MFFPGGVLQIIGWLGPKIPLSEVDFRSQRKSLAVPSDYFSSSKIEPVAPVNTVNSLAVAPVSTIRRLV